MLEEVFTRFGMQEIHSDTIERQLAEAGDRLVCIFCWGEDCFNCEVAKKAMLAKPEAIEKLELVWMHGNVYADRALGLKFGLHGVPVFVY
ncbi:MAG TPA: thioredoxin, partial [Noviherbaspirillum sp.]|nr:thioredoxin [Noviherbaspirillum sp.]